MIVLERTPAQRFSKRMVSIRFIQHMQDDLKAMEELSEAPSEMPRKIAYLNQAYILHLVAHWQVFIEELVRYGFELVRRKAPDSPLVTAVERRLAQDVDKFHTPKKESIDEIFRNNLGIDRITKSWSDGMIPNNRASETLDRVLKARHEIAHRGETDSMLAYDSNYADMETLVEMATVAERRLEDLLS